MLLVLLLRCIQPAGVDDILGAALAGPVRAAACCCARRCMLLVLVLLLVLLLRWRRLPCLLHRAPHVLLLLMLLALVVGAQASLIASCLGLLRRALLRLALTLEPHLHAAQGPPAEGLPATASMQLPNALALCAEHASTKPDSRHGQRPPAPWQQQPARSCWRSHLLLQIALELLALLLLEPPLLLRGPGPQLGHG